MSEKPKNFNIKIRDTLKLEFSVAAELEGFDMSGLIRNFMIRTVQTVKARDPQAFEAALQKAKASAEEVNKDENEIAIERTRGKGQLMEAPKSEYKDAIKEFDLEEIYQRVKAQGFDVDYVTIESVIVGEAPNVEEDLRKAILVASGLEEDYPRLKTNGA